jgi:hypothetical protein
MGLAGVDSLRMEKSMLHLKALHWTPTGKEETE